MAQMLDDKGTPGQKSIQAGVSRYRGLMRQVPRDSKMI